MIKYCANTALCRIAAMTGRICPRSSLGLLGFLVLLSGCASYQALPLARRSHLAPRLADLRAELPPAAAVGRSAKIDTTKPLAIDEIGLLAILNNPGLRSEAGEIGGARADVTQAATLPNPSVGLGYEALLGGPAEVGAYTATISQDVASIITYRSRVRSAEAHVGEVKADLLWREWHVAQRARLLAIDIYWGHRSISLSEQELALVSQEVKQVRSAISAGNLDLAALAPLLAAKASAEDSLAALNLDRLKNWQALDTLLGLLPDVRFAIAPPSRQPLPQTEALIASLPERRPDLIALQLGYRSSDEKVRSAILGQFPAFALGGSWSSDTSNVRSAGPSVTFDLPIFNRNQGPIDQARATRLQLHEQYQSRLDEADGTIRGLVARLRRLSADLTEAREAARSAESLSADARKAYAQGNLDQRTLTDYETTALHRELHVVDLEHSLDQDHVTLTLELGLGLPSVRIAQPDRTVTQ